MVIVGAVAAGGSAAFKIKRIDPEASVQVFEAGEYISYAACGLPYYVAGVISDYRRMIMRTPDDFQKAGVDLHTSCIVETVDPSRGEIRVFDKKKKRQKTVPFDNLLLATGACPLVPQIDGVKLKGVVSLRTMEDGLELQRLAYKNEKNRVVIIGGGYIGLELAEALRILGKEVTLVEQRPRVMPGIDDDMAVLLEEELTRNGVVLRTGETLHALEGDNQGHVTNVITDKAACPADLVVLALGVKPASQLAEEAGIQLGVKRAIAVDRYLGTSVPGIFAAGDCAETFHQVLKKNVYIPLGTTANRQGRVAAENICGGQKEYRGSLGSAVAKVFDLSCARTGLSEKEAQAQAVPAASARVEALDNAPYYPGGRPLHIKLVYHPLSGELLGGQIIGSERAVKRIDVLAAAITSRMTLDQLSEIDMAYAPPFAQVWDALSVAAAVAEGKRQRSKHFKGKEPG